MISCNKYIKNAKSFQTLMVFSGLPCYLSSDPFVLSLTPALCGT